MLLGSIEAGGTKFVCGIGDEQMNIIKRVAFPTTTPQETMAQVFAFFDAYNCDAIGIGSFGPIDSNKQSTTYGYITNTPKQFWSQFDFVGTMQQRYPNTKINFTTDVNAAVLGEHFKGAGKGLQHVLYLTVGTGIGGGMIVNNELFETAGAPEMGHVIVNPHQDDTFSGTCPFHNHCLEGMAAGPSFDARVGMKGFEVPTDHPSWEFVSYYVAQGLNNYTCVLRPQRIIIGGGVMKTEGILQRVKDHFEHLNNGYIPVGNIDDYIVLPGLEDDAGLTGGLLLAKKALDA